jgi:hypothetical protein
MVYFPKRLGCTCRVIYDTQISTQYVEEPDNYFVEITKDLVLKMRNIKICDCDEIPTEVTKVFSTVKEGYWFRWRVWKEDQRMHYRFRNKVLGIARCEANKVVGLKWICDCEVNTYC